jgi:hypothetical protein
VKLPPINLRRRRDAAPAYWFFRIQSRMAAQAGRLDAAIAWARAAAVVAKGDPILRHEADKLVAMQIRRRASWRHHVLPVADWPPTGFGCSSR